MLMADWWKPFCFWNVRGSSKGYLIMCLNVHANFTDMINFMASCVYYISFTAIVRTTVSYITFCLQILSRSLFDNICGHMFFYKNISRTTWNKKSYTFQANHCSLLSICLFYFYLNTLEHVFLSFNRFAILWLLSVFTIFEDLKNVIFCYFRYSCKPSETACVIIIVIILDDYILSPQHAFYQGFLHQQARLCKMERKI